METAPAFTLTAISRNRFGGLNNGTEAAPSLFFSNDTDSGAYLETAGTAVWHLVVDGDTALALSAAALVFNEDGADRDLRVESDTNTHAFMVDGNSTGSVGIGRAAATDGSTMLVLGGTVSKAAEHKLIDAGRTVTYTQNIATHRQVALSNDTINGGGVTVDDSVTLHLIAPAAGTATLTRRWSLLTGSTITAPVFAVSADGLVCIGDSAHSNVTIGLVVNQGTNDNLIFAGKSSDVATGLGSVAQNVYIGTVETDDYATFGKASSTGGGLVIGALAEDGAFDNSFILSGVGGTANTTKSTSGIGLLHFFAAEHDGANALANITADGNVFSIGARRGGANTTVMLVDEDGDQWLNGALSVGADHAGLASHVTFTNQVNNDANSSGVGTVLFKGATNRNSSGFLKVMDGTTARYIPYFDAITG